MNFWRGWYHLHETDLDRYRETERRMLNLRIDIQGQSLEDLEAACRRVLRLVDTECLSGHQKTETMNFDFVYEPADNKKDESHSGMNFRLPKTKSLYGGGESETST